MPSLQAFVNGVEGDLAAVIAGLTLSWSSVEGHVDRIKKMLKRQVYGPAGSRLWRRRVPAS
ncbi:hypothetical protein [Streptomyces sp. NPDC002265]|uniref:hypothetical protein n=1 Tax=Streptomyces sp. NPDC002265 TaxID=3154415 RepID=UPI0033345533